MYIDESKYKKQKELKNNWKGNNGIGTTIACTGFGKTYIAIDLVKDFNRGNPTAKTHVVVPAEHLYLDWVREETGHIAKHNLKNVEVFIINTYIKEERECDFLIVDEIHRSAAESFSAIFTKTKYRFILGLTCEIERSDERHHIIEQYCPVIGVVTLEEARKNNWVSNFLVFNYGISVDNDKGSEYEKIDTQYKYYFAWFNNCFHLAMPFCWSGKILVTLGIIERENDIPLIVSKEDTRVTRIERKTVQEWKTWWANLNNWDGNKEHPWSPEALTVYALQWKRAMDRRRTFIYRHPKKIEEVVKLVKHFNTKTLLFGEDTEIADKLVTLIPKCRSYHSKIKTEERIVTTPKGLVKKKFGLSRLKEEIVRHFNDGTISVMSTVRALKEGFNIEDVELCIMYAYNSSKIEDTQTTGRGIRVDYSNPNKICIIINLYIIGSQEEKWLKEKQRNKVNIIRVRSIEEIQYCVNKEKQKYEKDTINSDNSTGLFNQL